MSDLVTIGESTALFSAPQVGRLRDARSLDVSIAGAESNVSIGFCRLDKSSSWIGRVGNDEFGHLIIKTLRSEGVDVTGVIVDETLQTAVMFKERSADNVVRVSYYRRGHAGSALRPSDLNEEQIRAGRVLHVTGITVALSESARDAIRAAVHLARESGVLVSLDVNYRSRLWTQEEAAAVIRPLADDADIVFAGEDELFVFGDDASRDLRTVADDGRREVVIKRGARGARSITAEGDFDEPAVKVRAVDPVGAGDAFVAGYLVATLDGAEAPERLRQGCVAGAVAASRMGDWECLARRDDLDLLRHESGTTLR
jgi:2-dehydro-3-deoxygluconokinase